MKNKGHLTWPGGRLITGVLEHLSRRCSLAPPWQEGDGFQFSEPNLQLLHIDIFWVFINVILENLQHIGNLTFNYVNTLD